MQEKTSTVSPYRVGLFVDGFTLRKVNEYYRTLHPEFAGVNFLGLRNWAAVQASRYFWPGKSVELMAHYYHPYRDPDADGDFRHAGVKYFSMELSKAGFEVHFASVNYANRLCPNLELADDVMLYAEYRQLDALVLASTQGQFASVPLKLGAMNIPTLLLGWNFTYRNREKEVHWHTDVNLRREATFYVPMERIMNKASTDVLARNLFLSHRENVRACRGAFSGFPTGMSRLS